MPKPRKQKKAEEPAELEIDWILAINEEFLVKAKNLG